MGIGRQVHPERDPQAEIVVADSIHYAVAISFKLGMWAPIVVAKGKDALAKLLINTAREAKVPLVANPRLALHLYHSSEEQDEISEEFFRPVADALVANMSSEMQKKHVEAIDWNLKDHAARMSSFISSYRIMPWSWWSVGLEVLLSHSRYHSRGMTAAFSTSMRARPRRPDFTWVEFHTTRHPPSGAKPECYENE